MIDIPDVTMDRTRKQKPKNQRKISGLRRVVLSAAAAAAADSTTRLSPDIFR